MRTRTDATARPVCESSAISPNIEPAPSVVRMRRVGVVEELDKSRGYEEEARRLLALADNVVAGDEDASLQLLRDRARQALVALVPGVVEELQRGEH